MGAGRQREVARTDTQQGCVGRHSGIQNKGLWAYGLGGSAQHDVAESAVQRVGGGRVDAQCGVTPEGGVYVGVFNLQNLHVQVVELRMQLCLKGAGDVLHRCCQVPLHQRIAVCGIGMELLPDEGRMCRGVGEGVLPPLQRVELQCAMDSGTLLPVIKVFSFQRELHAHLSQLSSWHELAQVE